MPGPDPLLDPPSWAPSWASIDNVRTVRQYAIGLVVLAVLTFGACVIESASGPADPELVTSSTISVPSLSAGAVTEPEPAACPTTATGEPGSTLALVDTLGTATVRITTTSGVVEEFCVLVADESGERQTGLMGITDFSVVEGMLFVYGEDSSTPFIMVGTPTPLTISWWDGNGRFVSRADMRPCLVEDTSTCERFPPAAPYRVALELPQSVATTLTLGPDDLLEIVS